MIFMPGNLLPVKAELLKGKKLHYRIPDFKGCTLLPTFAAVHFKIHLYGIQN